MINNKKRQSQLFKKKAIMKYIMATFDRPPVSFNLMADDQLYTRFKAPFNKYYGYKVIKHAYYLKILKKERTDNSFTSYAKLKPVYNLCKVRKV